MGKKPPSDQKAKKKKCYINFDESARKEYLTGFHKRKQERKIKGQQMLDKKLKDKIKEERLKRRKTTKEKVEKLLEGITLPGKEEGEPEQLDTVDFGSHEVIVKSSIDFAESGMILAPSQKDKEQAQGSPQKNNQSKKRKIKIEKSKQTKNNRSKSKKKR